MGGEDQFFQPRACSGNQLQELTGVLKVVQQWWQVVVWTTQGLVLGQKDNTPQRGFVQQNRQNHLDRRVFIAKRHLGQILGDTGAKHGDSGDSTASYVVRSYVRTVPQKILFDHGWMGIMNWLAAPGMQSRQTWKVRQQGGAGGWYSHKEIRKKISEA
jgi:hypothetical protein